MVAVTVLAGRSAHAATATFTDNTANFSTGFTGGSGPGGQPATGDSLLFGAVGTAGTALTDDLFTPAAYSLAGITFNAGAAAYTIAPATAGTNGFTLASGGITNSSTSLETINDLITLAGLQTMTTTTGGGNLTLGGVVSGTGGGITTAGGGTLTLSAANTYTGATTIAAGTILTASNAGSFGTTANTAGVAVNGTLNLTAAGSAYTFGGALTGAGIINVSLGGGGSTTQFNGGSNFGTGFTGTVNVGVAGTTGGKFGFSSSPSASATFNVAPNGTLFFNSGGTFPAAITLGGGTTGESFGQLRPNGSATFSGPITLAGTVTGTNNSTFTAFGSTVTISGAIGQTGGAQGVLLGGSSPGTVVFSNTANTYTGATTVGVGTTNNNIVNLRVNGNIGSAAAPAGAVTVNSGSTLSGTGILTVASATLNTGSILAPGATSGATTGALTLNTTGGLTLSGGLTIGISGASGTSLRTTGLLTLSGATLTLNGTLNGTSNYDIANYGSLAPGSTFAGFTAPSGYAINYAGTNFVAQGGGVGDIELDAVPEPSTWAVVLLLMAGQVGISLRRRQKFKVA